MIDTGCGFQGGCVLGDLLNQCSPDSKRRSYRTWGPAPEPIARPLCQTGSLIPYHLSTKEQGILSDRYDVETEPLGSGTYGEVLAATHKKTGARRAVKSVDKASFAKFSKTKRDFLWRELDILRHLDHPNIVRMYEVFEDDRNIYLVLEICSGGDLLERVAAPAVRMSEQDAAAVFGQMLGAVQHLHVKRVVHRDIKPENFLFTWRECEKEASPPKAAPLKLIDFGLSRRLARDSPENDIERCADLRERIDQGVHTCRYKAPLGGNLTPRIGTSEYMAPEAADGTIARETADLSDMWSLGVVLHTMLTGHFPNKNLMTNPPVAYFAAPFWNRVSRDCRDILSKLLHFQPHNRLTSTTALQHPWMVAAFNADHYTVSNKLPDAIRLFASLQGLRRLVLVAAAREIDDREVVSTRNIFRKFQLSCAGSISRAALAQNDWDASLRDVAVELLRSFDVIDSNGSGTIDWTELVAASLCATGGSIPSADDDSNFEGAAGLGLNDAEDECICFKAFDLLSHGNGVVVCEGPGLESLQQEKVPVYSLTKGTIDSVSNEKESRRWFLT